MYSNQTPYRFRPDVDKIFIIGNTFNSPNLGNYSPYELTFGRKPKLLLNVETNPDIKVSRNFREYYESLNKRIKFLQIYY